MEQNIINQNKIDFILNFKGHMDKCMLSNIQLMII